MTALLALVMMATFGTWIPLAQYLPGVAQRSRTFYATVGNAALAGIALLAGGGYLALGWRAFWLPLVGGVVWTAGNYSAFRATEAAGLARAAETWSPSTPWLPACVIKPVWRPAAPWVGRSQLCYYPGVHDPRSATLSAHLIGSFKALKTLLDGGPSRGDGPHT